MPRLQLIHESKRSPRKRLLDAVEELFTYIIQIDCEFLEKAHNSDELYLIPTFIITGIAINDKIII